MASTCEQWQIPYLNLAEVHSPSDIPRKLSEVSPKIVLCSIEAISDPAVQSQLQSINVEYIAVDESQVGGGQMLQKYRHGDPLNSPTFFTLK